ncbi:MAG: hypothetical protein E5Y88_12335 [Mesorhizobium sp.]|uniref:hypothetical protein n=1 Tax=Mesorhizobium sp. TaxID=1871066 RepID=UPI00121B3A17|nr:hypothetical protein [Mesorhizobium sp.]TIL25729.1 MAG: hypothetical protein E5Y88_12335 [Mesorhizobium sp.]
MSRNRAGILYATALILLGIVMGGWHWMLVGISRDFGAGLAVGFTICLGAMGIILRSVREL